MNRNQPYRFREAKDPDAVLDYQIDWSSWLASEETLTDSVWEVTGATALSSSFDEGITTVWLSGGEVGTLISATNRITTSEGRIDDRTVQIPVAER